MMAGNVRYKMGAPLAALLLLVLMTGCVTFGPKPPATQPANLDPTPPTRTPSSPEEDPEAKMAAGAEFLQRTAEYQRPEQEAVPATTPAILNQPTPRHRVRIDPMAIARDPMPAPARAVSTNAQMSVADVALAADVPALPIVRSLSIRTLPAEPPVVEAPPQTKTANAPLTTGGSDARRLMDRFFGYLKDRAAASEGFEGEWQLRMAQLALHREDDALELSPHISGDSRDLFQSLIQTATAVRGLLRNPLLTGDKALERVDHLRTLLATRADPEVSTVALCRKVVTFGVYDGMSDTDFVAGRSIPAIVYTEISNFTSKPTDDERYRTVFATRLEVLTAEGQSVWTHEEPEIEDLCRRRRNDFFVAQRITLPPTLSAGSYVLKVLVEDKLSGKADEALHHFNINAAVTSARMP